MASQTGRYVVTFNGEIYNFAAIRALLGDNIEWRGHSGTEVLLAAVERWGVRAAVERCAGMFAIALWDRQEHALHLVRDRLGEKVSDWLAANPSKPVTSMVVTQSSDSSFHCIAITVFYHETKAA